MYVREGRLGVAQAIECAFPQERYQHIAAIYGDDLYVFGGYAMFCEDYCEDMWRATLTKCRTVMYPGCAEWSEADDYDPVKPHPYKRWRSASTLIRARSDLPGFWFVFGGYRLWHGFRTDNYIDNLWSNYDVDCTPEEWSECRFQGGYGACGTWTCQHQDGFGCSPSTVGFLTLGVHGGSISHQRCSGVAKGRMDIP